MGTRTQIVDAVMIVIIELSKLFGEDFYGQELEFKRKGNHFSFGIVAISRKRYFVKDSMEGYFPFYLLCILLSLLITNINFLSHPLLEPLSNYQSFKSNF